MLHDGIFSWMHPTIRTGIILLWSRDRKLLLWTRTPNEASSRPYGPWPHRPLWSAPAHGGRCDELYSPIHSAVSMGIYSWCCRCSGPYEWARRPCKHSTRKSISVSDPQIKARSNRDYPTKNLLSPDFLKNVTPENQERYSKEVKSFSFVNDCPVFERIFDYCQASRV